MLFLFPYRIPFFPQGGDAFLNNLHFSTGCSGKPPLNPCITPEPLNPVIAIFPNPRGGTKHMNERSHIGDPIFERV